MASRFRNAEAATRSGEKIDFSFGENWQQYLSSLKAEDERHAVDSLHRGFDTATVAGRSFVDVGCGSGLFSLAAFRGGALRVVSVDIDPNSLECAARLRAGEGDPEQWEIRRGSVLDARFIRSLGQFERVYSWGVLHHTGALRDAIDNTLDLVAPGGWCLLALYNRPPRPEFHLRLKRMYNGLPRVTRPAAVFVYGTARLVKHAVRGRSPRRLLSEYAANARGMSYWRDVEDWLGGLPWEYIDEGEFRVIAKLRGFDVVTVRLGSPGANNEYLLWRRA